MLVHMMVAVLEDLNILLLLEMSVLESVVSIMRRLTLTTHVRCGSQRYR